MFNLLRLIVTSVWRNIQILSPLSLKRKMSSSFIFSYSLSKHSLKMWLPWQQGKSIFLILVSKDQLYIFRKIHKVLRKNILAFGVMLQKPQGGFHPPNPNRVTHSYYPECGMELNFKIFTRHRT